MSDRMEEGAFDDTDYSVVVKIRGSPPNPWRWEIYRAGKSHPIGQSPVFFRTMAAANKAGKAALKQLLAKLNTNPSRREALSDPNAFIYCKGKIVSPKAD